MTNRFKYSVFLAFAFAAQVVLSPQAKAEQVLENGNEDLLASVTTSIVKTTTSTPDGCSVVTEDSLGRTAHVTWDDDGFVVLVDKAGKRILTLSDRGGVEPLLSNHPDSGPYVSISKVKWSGALSTALTALKKRVAELCKIDVNPYFTVKGPGSEGFNPFPALTGRPIQAPSSPPPLVSEPRNRASTPQAPKPEAPPTPAPPPEAPKPAPQSSLDFLKGLPSKSDTQPAKPLRGGAKDVTFEKPPKPSPFVYAPQ